MNWDVERLSKNVHRVNIHDVRAGWAGRAMISGDRHHDNPQCRRDLEKQHLELAREENAPIVEVGDLFCAMQGKKDPRSRPRDLDPELMGEDAYFDALVNMAGNFYAPYAKQFAVLGLGNHETSVLDHNQTNLTTRLAARLRTESGAAWPFTGGYGGYVYFTFHIHSSVRQTVKLKYFHGSGGGGPVTKGVIQTNRRAVRYPDADLIVTGHIHESWLVNLKRERVTRQGRIHTQIQTHLQTATYKDEYGAGKDGWHVERGADPKPLGCVWLRFELDTTSSSVRVVPELDVI